MQSVRSIARAAPRAASRFVSVRPSIRTASILQQAWKPARVATFSTSFRMRDGEVSKELSSKLASELEMEQEIRDADEVPPTVKDFLETGSWEIVDTVGEEEVVLKKKFGNESIQVTFSIADINTYDPESDAYNPERAYGDEEGNPAQRDEEGLEGDEEPEQSFPSRLGIIIEKAGRGAVAVEAVAQDGMLVLENVYHYTDASLAYAKTPETLHKRQDVYVGPPFGNLDEELQVLLERYLDERGINSSLAQFVPEYTDMKEQKEYLRWLKNVKGFVDA